MKKTHFLLLGLLFFAFFGEINAQNASKIRKNIKIFSKDQTYKNSVIGIFVANEKGKTIASLNPDMPLLTASTMKTVTTGIALNLFGPDFKFTTKIGYRGEIKDSTLFGDLIIYGGGDPTLGSSDTVAFPIGDIFEKWYYFIKDNGIKRIEGSIIGDDSYLKNEPIPDSWSWSNIGASYGSAPSGLSFNENIQTFKLKAPNNLNENAVLEEVYPVIPNMKYVFKETFGKKMKGNSLTYYTSDLSRVGEFKGDLSSDGNTFIINGSNKFPALSCAYHFKEYLENKGIKSNNDVLSTSDSDIEVTDSEIKFIGETYSKELFKIVNVTNRISNNFYAETLLKMIGKRVTGVGSYDSSIVAVKRLLNDMNVGTKGFTSVDGSGLSRQNYVSPRFFGNYFLKMKESTNFVMFLNSLPQPGGPGTLKNVLADTDILKKSAIHAKSGSLANVKCYAGYVERKRGGVYVFAILTNNYQMTTSEIMKGIEAFMKTLIN